MRKQRKQRPPKIDVWYPMHRFKMYQFFPSPVLAPPSCSIPYLCKLLVFVHTALMRLLSTILLFSERVPNWNRMNMCFVLLSSNATAVGPARMSDFSECIFPIFSLGWGKPCCPVS